MPNFTLNDIEFYDVPKNGGTTIRMWLKYYEDSVLDIRDLKGYYNLANLGFPRGWNDNVRGKPRFFSLGESKNLRWCITRDPVERFISAYTDKVLYERLAHWSVDECLSMLESGQMERIARGKKLISTKKRKLAATHFLGQCIWLGTDKGYFDEIFNINQMKLVKEFCEDRIFKIVLPPLHARNQSQTRVEKIKLTEAQRLRIANIFSEDYSVGWY